MIKCLTVRKITPPIYFFVLLLLALGLHFVVPIKQIISWPYRFIGIGFILFGGWVEYAADKLFKRKETTVKPLIKPITLVQEGPFQS